MTVIARANARPSPARNESIHGWRLRAKTGQCKAVQSQGGNLQRILETLFFRSKTEKSHQGRLHRAQGQRIDAADSASDFQAREGCGLVYHHLGQLV